MFRATQPLQELVNHGTHMLSVGLLQFRPFNGIQRAIVEREKRRFYTYWCKTEVYLSATREEMTSHKFFTGFDIKDNWTNYRANTIRTIRMFMNFCKRDKGDEYTYIFFYITYCVIILRTV